MESGEGHDVLTASAGWSRSSTGEVRDGRPQPREARKRSTGPEARQGVVDLGKRRGSRCAVRRHPPVHSGAPPPARIPAPSPRAVASRRPFREAHVPAQHSQALEDPRLSHPHADPRRSGRAPGPPRPRPEAAVGLIWRVRDRATFQALARAPRHRVGPVSLRFSNRGSTDPPRVSYAVGRRVGSAVERNRVRRRLRAAVAASADQLVGGGAYLVEAERPVLTLAFSELCASLGMLIRAARDGRA